MVAAMPSGGPAMPDLANCAATAEVSSEALENRPCESSAAFASAAACEVTMMRAFTCTLPADSSNQTAEVSTLAAVASTALSAARAAAP